jgi:rhodanese-related sulfurtransferase
MALDRRWLPALLLSLMLALSVSFVPGCDGADEDDDTGVEDEQEAPDDDEDTGGVEDGEETFDVSQEILAATGAYLDGSPAPTMSAADLYNAVIAGDTSVQIVDIRAPEHFERGHVEGAINVPYEQITSQEQLDRLDDTKRVVVVCYTGHTASMTSMYLNQLGYDAVALEYGISGWTTDEDVYGLDPFPTGEAGDYPLEKGIVEAEPAYDLPAISVDAGDVRAAIIECTQAYFDTDPAATISADDVYDDVVAPDAPGYQILSVRSPDHYGFGHVPGAIDVAWATIADPANLRKLDPDKTIVVYGYTGHTGAQVSMFLNQMGYDAIDMEGGMSSWTSDADVRATSTYNPSEVPNYPTVSGADPDMPAM